MRGARFASGPRLDRVITTTSSAAGRGTIFSASAYALWGLLPLYFILLVPMAPEEIVGWRVLFSVPVCLVIVAATRAWRPIALVLRRPRLLLLVGLGAVLIYLNWWLFTIAATSGNVVEASLGYFITPIVSVALGVLILRERVRPLQAAAFVLSAVAVVVLAALYGAVPWTALAIALSFGLYGFVKKVVGVKVDAVTGLAVETAWTVPMAAVQLAIVASTAGLQIGTLGPLNAWALPFSGVVTALPMLLFAAGTRLVPMVTIGMLQFIEPLIQFITGALLLREDMPPERLLGFGVVWVAVALFVIDAVAAARRRPRAPVTAQESP